MIPITTPSLKVHYSDRSTCTTHQSCPRKRWLQHEHPTPSGVGGVVPAKLNMDLMTGLGFHEGCHALYLGCSVDEAVGRALEGHGDWRGYWPQVRDSGFALESNEDASYVAFEQAAMVEALIRGYHCFALPQLHERFDIVEAEKDEAAKFSLPTLPDFILEFGARTDALLLDRTTQDLVVLSLKTKKEWKPKDDRNNRYDMQGATETAVVEQRLRRWHKLCEENLQNGVPPGVAPPASLLEQVPEWFIARYRSGASPEVLGVKMEFALKGRRSEYPRGSGRYVYSNPLIRPWKKSEDLGRPIYAFRYDFTDEVGGNHRLGKGWRSINIWEDMGVREWISLLASESLQGFPPGTAIAEQFVLPIEYFRNQSDIDRRLRQIIHQEHQVSIGKGECLAALGTPEFEAKLDQYFPMHSDYPSSCVWCEYEGVCHGPESYLHDPLSSGIFQPRSPNHKREMELVQIQ